jgi:hypothetical protein
LYVKKKKLTRYEVLSQAILGRPGQRAFGVGWMELSRGSDAHSGRSDITPRFSYPQECEPALQAISPRETPSRLLPLNRRKLRLGHSLKSTPSREKKLLIARTQFLMIRQYHVTPFLVRIDFSYYGTLISSND